MTLARLLDHGPIPSGEMSGGSGASVSGHATDVSGHAVDRALSHSRGCTFGT